MRVHANRDACVGAGQCVRTAPAVFDQDEEEGLVKVKVPSPGAELAGVVRQAARLCPAMAITIDEVEGGAQEEGPTPGPAI